MERRTANISISSAGGTAAKGAKTYKISLPTVWMNTLSITDGDRNVEMSFDGERIVISRRSGCGEFVKQKKTQRHDVCVLRYYDKEALCTTICADFTDKTLAAENHTDIPEKTAFGNNPLPIWADFEAFLEDRCLPRSRAGMREYLDAIGVCEYDPFEIVKITKGRMAEDEQWMEIEILQ